MEGYTLFHTFLMGAVFKIYDDLTELYLIKNQRLLEGVKVTLTTLILLYMGFLIQNQYDLHWLIFMWIALPLADWDALTADPYFSSIILLAATLSGVLFVTKEYYKVFHLGHFALAFFLYILAIPPTEFFNIELNGAIHYLLKKLKILPEGSGYFISNKSKEELEVSEFKFINRGINILACLFLMGILYLLSNYIKTSDYSQIFTSAIYFSLFNIGYYAISMVNQVYVLYFNKDILKLHRKESVSTDL